MGNLCNARHLETILAMKSFSSRILAGLFMLLTPPSCSVVAASQTAQVDPLSGLWGTEVRFGMQAADELTLDGRGNEWRALLAGYQVAVQTSDGDFRFKLPGDAGEFRGHLDAAANEVRGQWIQPKGELLSQYASPIELHSIAPLVWRGTVIPLEQRISMYASISLSSDGKLKAFLSNPEMNFFGGRIFNVTREGAKVHLDAKGWKIEGTYDDKSDMLSLQLLDDSLPPFQFSRPGTCARHAIGQQDVCSSAARAGEGTWRETDTGDPCLSAVFAVQVVRELGRTEARDVSPGHHDHDRGRCLRR